MLINEINLYGNSKQYYPIRQGNNNFLPDRQETLVNSKPQLSQDTFMKSEPHKNISFLGGFAYISKTIQAEFPKSFFKKLADAHLPCAYTGVEMVSRADYDELIKMEVLKKKSPVAIKFLKKFKDSMFETEKTIFSILETESKKHPDLKLQELLQLKYPAAEKTLIKQQSDILNKINLTIRSLPKSEYEKVRTLIQQSFNKIFAQDPLPEDRFKRKDFIYSLKTIDISDKNIKRKIIATAEKIPNSEDSINAFIVKYSQPYKIKYENGEPVKLPRDSEELGLRLLQPSLATDEHIYPQTLYRKEDLARQKGDKTAKNLSSSRVTILTTERINGLKSDMLLDDLIKKSPYDIKENIQNHINRLIHLSKVWMKKGQIEDAFKLTEYIAVLKEEFQRRSKSISIDTKELDEILPGIHNAYSSHMQKMTAKKHKHISHSQNANNTHKEAYTRADGKTMHNRKIQKHSSRFSK